MRKQELQSVDLKGPLARFINYMNYFDARFAHILSVFIMFLSITITLYKAEGSVHKVVSIIFSLIVLASGVLLLRKFGISHTGPFPAWVLVKVVLWLAVTIISPMIVKKLPHFAHLLLWPWYIVLAVAVYMSIYKPL